MDAVRSSNYVGDPSSFITAPSGESGKRKRDSGEDNSAPPPPQKSAKTTSAHLAINYLARQYDEDLPLISNDDTLPHIIQLLNEYQGVLDRHESMACNLGARPLGPILMKRFERLFDGPPRVLKHHGKEGNLVTWLDVVEFARNKPEQFTLGQMNEGSRVCQFHTKQCRVQITEEDYLLISSGMPQKLIPPQPIVEDEEKELGTLEILEKNLSSICHAADQVAARTRQLRHRISGRKQAILERRANEPGHIIRGTSPSVLNGGNGAMHSPSTHAHLQPVFVAVNGNNGSASEYGKTGASMSTHNELMSKFFTKSQKGRRNAEKISLLSSDERQPSSTVPGASESTSATYLPGMRGRPRHSFSPLQEIHSGQEQQNNAHSHLPGETFPSKPIEEDSNLPQISHMVSTHQTHHSKSGSGAVPAMTPRDKEDDGPFKSEMIIRVETLRRGDRVMPPCDRCRRLHMDCIKNLTACQGCTKKHAKCSWRDVRRSEIFGPDGSKILIPAVDGEREPSVGHRPEEPDQIVSSSPKTAITSNGTLDGNADGSTYPGALQTASDSGYYSGSPQHRSFLLAAHISPESRHDTGRLLSPREEHLHLQAAHGSPLVDRASVAHPDHNRFGDKRDGHLPVVA